MEYLYQRQQMAAVPTTIAVTKMSTALKMLPTTQTTATEQQPIPQQPQQHRYPHLLWIWYLLRMN